MTRILIWRIFFTVVSLILASSCGERLDEQQLSQLRGVNIALSFKAPKNRVDDFQSAHLTSPTPTSGGEINCVAVLMTANGKTPVGNCTSKVLDVDGSTALSSKVFGVHKVAGLFPLVGGIAEFTLPSVPTGIDLSVVGVGFKSSVGCSSLGQGFQPGTSSVSVPYVLAEKSGIIISNTIEKIELTGTLATNHIVSYCDQAIFDGSNIADATAINVCNEVPGCTLHHDAFGASSNNFTIVSGGISQWNDLSGNNNHSTQSTAASRPQYVTSAFSGKGGVYFDGSNFYLSASVKPITTDQAIFIVFAHNSPSADATLLSASTGAYSHIKVTNTPNIKTCYNDAGCTGAEITDSTSLTAGTPYIVTLVSDGMNQYSFLNETAFSPIPSYAVGSAPTDNYKIGAVVGNTQNFKGMIGEIVIYNQSISQTERQLIITKLKQKWGVP